MRQPPKEGVAMAIRYKIFLTSDERSTLEEIIKKGTKRARTVILALGLLLCDLNPEGTGKKTNAEISRELRLSERTIESLKKRFTEGGIDKALQRKPKTVNPKEIKFDGAFEARLIALACSSPPEGRSRWTIRLLADKLVELHIAPEGISHTTVHRTLKKTKLALISSNTTRSHLNITLNS
jgi:transposase